VYVVSNLRARVHASAGIPSWLRRLVRARIIRSKQALASLSKVPPSGQLHYCVRAA
jgi:hypothetical protein